MPRQSVSPGDRAVSLCDSGESAEYKAARVPRTDCQSEEALGELRGCLSKAWCGPRARTMPREAACSRGTGRKACRPQTQTHFLPPNPPTSSGPSPSQGCSASRAPSFWKERVGEEWRRGSAVDHSGLGTLLSRLWDDSQGGVWTLHSSTCFPK